MSARTAALPRLLTAGLTAVLMVLGVVTGLLAPGTARADSAPVDPADPTTPPTVSADPLPTVQINGVAWAQLVVGTTVYVAGEFSSARPAGVPAGSQETPRGNLLAYDIRTGQLLTSFAPDLNAQALALAASPDGSRIYVGGDFTRADGQTRYHVAAYSTATGQLISEFRPAVDAQVGAIAATNTTVYLGGEFSAVGSTRRNRLAAVSAANGALLSWAPQPGVGSTAGNTLPNDPAANSRTSNTVLAMVLAGPNGQVVVAGRFDTLNGVKATGVGALDGTSGATRPFAANKYITNQGVNSAIWSLSTDGGTVYGTGYNYYGPGNLEGSFAADANGGTPIWFADCRGDTYSAFASGDVVYTASHEHDCANIGGGFPEQSPRVNMFANAFTKARTGTNVRTSPLIGGHTELIGQPAPAQLAWAPTFYNGTYTGQYQAGWSVTGNRDYVVYGGEFPGVNGSEQQGLVRFAVREIAPNKVAPRTTATFAPSATMIPGAVRLSWPAVSDRDNEFLTYRVYRDGATSAPACQTAQPSQWWSLPTYACADTGAAAGAHSYVVRVSDPFGNTLSSTALSVTVPAGSAGSGVRGYDAAVDADGAVDHWRLGETAGTTAYDYAGPRNMTAGTGVTRGVTGAIANDGDKAYRFTGTSAGSLATQTAQPGPRVFTVEAWFQTTTTRGGKIVGFGNARTGLSTQYDRHLYMDAQGRVYFGVYNGAQRLLGTSAALNDGRWHHVAGTLGSRGLALYVDGALVGSRADVTTVNATTGYWRVGGDKSWATGLDWFAGQIDEVAVYSRALPAQQLAAHYQAGRTGKAPNTAPTAAFTSSVSGLTVAVDGSTSSDAEGPIASYAWDFGDGGTATGPTASHNYTAAGTYPLKLTVTDGDGATGTISRFVTIAAPPAAGVLADDTFGREVSGGWGSADFGGAWTISGGAANAAVTGGSGRLTAAAGGTTAARLPIAARDVAVRADVLLEQAPTGGGSYVSLGSRTVGSSRYDAQLWFSATGTARLSLVSVVNGTETELAAYTLPGSYSAGSVLTVRFEVSGAAPTTLRARAWASGAAEPAAWQVTATDSAVALQQAGGVEAELYTSKSATGAQTLRVDNLRAAQPGTDQPVNSAPTAAFTSSVSGLTVAVDGSPSSDPEGPVASYAWDFGDGGTATGPTASHDYATDGDYTVTLTVTDAAGVTGSADEVVTVAAPPPPADDVLASDAFEREVTGGWGTADVGGAWTTTSGSAANAAVTGGSGRLTAAAGGTTATELPVTAQDVAVQVDVAPEKAPAGGGSYVSVGARSGDGSRYNAQLAFSASGAVTLSLVSVVNWTETQLGSVRLPGSYTPGSVLTVRFEAVGNGTTTLRAMAWASGAAEPADWQVTATDSAPTLQRAGSLRVELYESKSAGRAQTVRVDDVWVGAPGTTP